MLQKLSIRTQILVTFATLATISLLIVGGVSLTNASNLGVITEDLATQALDDQINRNIEQTSLENAAVIEKKFANAEADVNKIASAAKSIFSGDLVFDPIQSYAESELNSIPDAEYDAVYDEVISVTTSTYYHGPSVAEAQLTAEQNQTIELSAHMDGVFASIYETTDEYVWMYFTFAPDLGGTFRNFPGAEVSGLDPTIDPYYSDPVSRFGEMTYIAPYFDPTQGLIISITKAVYVDNTLIGAAGIDFKSSVIRDKVLDVSFLDSGYAALIESNDMLVVAHPEFQPQFEGDEETTIQEIEVTLDDKGNTIPALDSEDLFIISSGGQGVISYTRNSDAYYLSYAPIRSTDGDAQYIFLISVLVSEVVEPVDLITARIQTSVANVRNSVIFISILTLVGTLIVGLWIAGNITRPVSRLTRIARQITQNATKEDIFDGVTFDKSLESDDEIGELSRSFQTMVGKLREEQRQKSKKN
ncbi:MAG: HAMP domain-containing protein [Candidatus Kariarchaeaceae archaeon]|jgi:HAMP domain-containing protein